jgi:predicted aspartyl protease
LKEIGLIPAEVRQFRTITGAVVERQIGYAILSYNGRTGAINVVFSEAGDMEVLGVTGLESLSMTPDPIEHKLVPVVAPAV